MMMPTPTAPDAPQPRSRGPLSPAPAGAAYDPAQIGWTDPARPDDLDPDGDDLLAPPGPDAASRAGLVLRPWGPGDLASFRALLDDPRVWAHLPEDWPGALDEGRAAALLDLANRLEGHAVRAVLAGGVPVGQVRLEPGADGASAEISYWLGAAHWGKGWGSALVAAAARRALARRPDLLRLTAKVHPGNPASLRVLAKAGFRPCAAPAGRFADWRWLHLRRQWLD